MTQGIGAFPAIDENGTQGTNANIQVVWAPEGLSTMKEMIG